MKTKGFKIKFLLSGQVQLTKIKKNEVMLKSIDDLAVEHPKIKAYDNYRLHFILKNDDVNQKMFSRYGTISEIMKGVYNKVTKDGIHYTLIEVKVTNDYAADENNETYEKRKVIKLIYIGYQILTHNMYHNIPTPKTNETEGTQNESIS